MPWTEKQKLEALLRLPWTLVPELTPEGESALRVKELPPAVGYGVTAEEIMADFWGSLTATLECYLQFGDPIPLPPGVLSLPWETSVELAPQESYQGTEDLAAGQPPTAVAPKTASLAAADKGELVAA
jgi:hypothetical protein